MDLIRTVAGGAVHGAQTLIRALDERPLLFGLLVGGYAYMLFKML